MEIQWMGEKKEGEYNMQDINIYYLRQILSQHKCVNICFCVVLG